MIVFAKILHIPWLRNFDCVSPEFSRQENLKLSSKWDVYRSTRVGRLILIYSLGLPREHFRKSFSPESLPS